MKLSYYIVLFTTMADVYGSTRYFFGSVLAYVFIFCSMVYFIFEINIPFTPAFRLLDSVVYGSGDRFKFWVWIAES